MKMLIITAAVALICALASGVLLLHSVGIIGPFESQTNQNDKE